MFEASGKSNALGFTATASGYELRLSPDEAVFHIAAASNGGADVGFRLTGANTTPEMRGRDRLTARTFHYIGDRSGWRTDVPNYRRVEYYAVYPGTDLLYYGNQGRVEFDFVVHPGADPSAIRLQTSGAHAVTIDSTGNIRLESAAGGFILEAPKVYQETRHGRKSVPAHFVLTQSGEIGFDVAAYDRKLPLIIDPALSYATYIGRSSTDQANGVAWNAADGTVYLAGLAPATGSVTQNQAFIAHLSADGSTLLYLAYLGGTTGLTEAHAIAVDSAGNAYVTGRTTATDLPVTSGSTCHLDGSNACADAFVVKLDSTGALVYGTYLGGSGADVGNAIAVDGAGHAYVGGSTTSTDLTIAQAAQTTSGGATDGFVAELSSDGTQIVRETYAGGSANDEVRGLALDSGGAVYVTGTTSSQDFPVHNAYQSACVLQNSTCNGEAFVAKYDASGSVVYSTYLGGSGGDQGNAIAVDDSGNAYAVGTTASTDFPVRTHLAGGAANNGQSDAFIAKFSFDGSSLVYSSYLGGSGNDSGLSVAVVNGAAVVAGSTSSTDLATAQPVQASCALDGSSNCQDGFVTVLDPTGTQRWFASYLGGSAADQLYSVAASTSGDGAIFLAGASTSASFNTNPATTVNSATLSSGQPTYLGSTPSTAMPSTLAGAFAAMMAGATQQPAGSDCTGSVTWTGNAGDHLWSTAGNWSTGTVPVATDDVCIGAAYASTTITVSNLAAANQAINTLTSFAPLNMNTNLVIAGAAQFQNLTVSGGTLAFNGETNVSGTMALNARVTGTGTLNIAGLFTWSGGQMCTTSTCSTAASASVTNVNGGMSITGSMNLYGRVLNNRGTATLNSSNSFVIGYGAVLNNLAGATWNFAGDGYISTAGAGYVFNNAGTLEKTSGTNISYIYPPLNNTGSIQANSGTLLMYGGGSGSGTWSAATGATLQFASGTFNLSGEISGAGTVNFVGGTENLTGNYNITGATHANGATINFNSPGTVTSTGALAIASGVLNFSTGGTITTPSLNETGGTLAGPDTVTVTGNLTWSGGNMCATSACSSSDTPGAVINANGGLTLSGYEYLHSRTLNNPGTATQSGNGYFYLYYGATVNNAASATWNIASDANVYSAGPTNTFNNAGLFEKTAGTGTSEVDPTFANTGSVQADSGTLRMYGGGSGNGTWSVATGATLQFTNGTYGLSGGISGAGTVNFAGGTQTLTGNYNITGATQASGGTVNFTSPGTVTSTGALTVMGSTVNFATGNPVTVPSLGETGGTLAGPDTLNVTGMTTWSGGSICATSGCSSSDTPGAVINANGGLTLSGYEYLHSRTLNNPGTATQSGNGYLYLYYGATVNNAANATWNITDNSLIYAAGTNTFNNAGLFEKTGGTGTSEIDPTFANTGSVQVNSGTLRMYGGGSGNGTWSVASGTTLQFNGTFNLSGGISGAGTVNFAGGTENLTGNYNITGATQASSGTANFNSPGTVTSTGALTITGGVLNFATGNPVAVPSLAETSGTLAGPDTVTVTGMTTWSGGNVCATSACSSSDTPGAVINANGGLTLSGYEYLHSRTLNNPGTATQSGNGYFYLYYGATVNNPANATWNVMDNSSIYAAGGTNAFNNGGLLEKTGGTGTSEIDPTFANTGSVHANSGTLYMYGGGSGNGTWSVASGATLQFGNGTFNLSGDLGGAGTASFTGATVNLSGTYSLTGPTNITGGIVNFNEASPVSLAGPVNFSGGTIAGPTTVNLNGLLTWSGGQICVTSACLTTDTPGAIVNANGGIALSGGTNLHGRTLNNTATATQSGTGYIQLLYGSAINNAANATWNFSGDGKIYASGGTNTFSNAGLFEKTGGTSQSEIDPVFTNTGTVQANSSTLYLYGGGSGNGTWNVASGATLNFQNGAYNLSGDIGGAGTASFTGATVNLSGTYSLTGTTNITGGSVNFTEASPVSLAGPVNFTGGIIAGPTTVNLNGLVTWSGGQICVTGACSSSDTPGAIVNANGGIALSGATNLHGRTLNNTATVTQSGTGYIQLLYGSAINNVANATWNLSGDGKIYASGGTNTFSNAGLFEKTGGTSQSEIDPIFTNTGTVQANSGTLYWWGGYTQTAGTTSLGGGGMIMNGASPLSLQGGSLVGTGTITGNVSDAGGTVAPGITTATGALTLSASGGAGNYSQGASGAYSVKIGGTAAGQFDSMTAGGTATLSGTLNVALLNGFMPSPGQAFVIVQAGAVSGQFANVNFPSVPGLTWSVNYATTAVTLTVTGAPAVSLSPSGPFTFPSEPVGVSSNSQTVTLTNVGTVALSISSIQPTGNDPADFPTSSDCPLQPNTLAPNGTCHITFHFQPTAPGSRSATITVTDNASDSPQQMSVSGTGTLQADLSIQKTAPPTVTSGNNLSYTITITNNGPSDASSVNMSDTLPAGTTFVSATQAGGPASFSFTTPAAGSGGTVTGTAATVASGTSDTITLVVNVASTTTGPITNSATVSSSTTDPNTSNNSASVTTSSTATADLAITKTGPSTVTAGSNVSYTVTVTNNGPAAASSVSLADTLPAGESYVSQTQTAGPAFTLANSGSSISDTIGSLASGASASFTITAQVSANAAGGSTLNNTASVSSATTDPNAANNSATATSTVAGSADLSITKTAPSGVVSGTNLTYTITVANQGPSDAQNVTVSDVLPSGATFGNQTQTSGPAFTLSNSGNTVSDTIATLPSGSSATISLTVQVAPSVAGGTVLNNTAQVSSSTTDPTATNNSATASTTVSSGADLSITKTASPTATAGGNLTYTITVANNGPSDAQSVSVADTLPAGTTFVSQSQTSGPAFTLANTGNSVSDTISTLPVGSSAVISVTTRLGSSTASGTNVTNTATVNAGTTDSSLANNSASATTTVGTSADLSVSKAGPSTATSGTQISYTITVLNNGPSDAQNVSLADALPAGLTFVSQSQTAGPSLTLANSGNSISDSIATLASGASVTISVTAQVGSNVASGTVLTNTATTSTSTTDPVSSNNSSSVATTVTAGADLSVTKTAPANVTAGGNVTYTITVSNNGPSDAQNVSLNDTLPSGLTLQGQTQTSGPAFTLSNSGNAISDTIATLLSGASATINVTAHLPASTAAGTTVSNTATVNSSTADPSASNNTATASSTVGTSADVAVLKSGPSAAAAGSDATYTITVTNNGPSDAQNVSISDVLPAGLTFVSQSQTSGPGATLANSGNSVNDTIGRLPAGTSATISLTAQVGASVANGTVLTNTATVNSGTTDAVSSNNSSSVSTTVTGAAPVVTANPTDQAVSAGQTATFTAAATGQPTPTVQWQMSTDGGTTFAPITGATSTTLSFTTTASQNGYRYEAVFTNGSGTATTTAATLTVNTAPTVTQNPANQTVSAGQMATFTAAASGQPTPTVQWQVSTDGGTTFTPISGATSTTLSFAATASQSGNRYEAVFTNSAGTATTTAATLTVNTAPVVTTNPADQTVNPGQTATFTAAASGQPTPTVQWQVSTDGGTTFTPISGATSTTLSFAATSSQNGNRYEAVFTNSAGTATTTAAMLTVNTAPVVTTNPADQTVNPGQTATFTAAASGQPTPTVQWQVSTDGGTTFTPISGATSTTLSFAATSSQSGNRYQAVFTDSAGTATTTAATLTVNTAPVVTTNPADQTVNPGQTATFTAAASGQPTPTVQWQVSTDGGTTFTPISGATSTTLSFAATTSQNGNRYQAVFTNSAGTATTTAATLTVSVPVTVGASIAGVQFSVDGTSYSSPQSFNWVVGSVHSVSTTSPQAGGTGTQYVFNNWSDGGAISHNVTTPAAGASYTANFDTQYQLTTAATTGGTVSPASGNYYLAGSVVNLAATASSGYTFSSWSGPVASASSASTTVTMSGPVSVTANFTANVTSGTVTLVTTATLARQTDGSIVATVKISNTGTGTATNVVLTGATLGSATGSPLPQSLGNIAAGGSVTTTVQYPSSAGASGTIVLEKYSGTYTGGTFGATLRAKLP